jgi:OOP family OmpA-OmpF porin
MRNLRSFSVLLASAALLSLSACAPGDTEGEVKALRETPEVGSPFTKALAHEYRRLANGLYGGWLDSPDAYHFARKGLTAAAGEVVMPEPMSDWRLQERHLEPLRVARGRLINAFDNAGREISPYELGMAQVAFDCWLEQQEDGWYNSDPSCRQTFEQSMAAAEARLNTLPVPPMPPMDLYTGIAPDPSSPPLMLAEDAKYLIFFDFDRSDLSADAGTILDTVAQEISRQTLDAVVIVGHADRSGSNEYNDKLSMRRAESVRQGLIWRGVPTNLIQVRARGENEPMVATDDNVREPANRRAEITFSD